MWFREYDKGHRLPDIPIFFCYEGINFLRLMPLTIYQSDLTANGDFMEYKHHHQFNSNLSLRGAALILDRTWNNAYLVPKSHKATLTADSYHDRRRHAITRYCTPSLLRRLFVPVPKVVKKECRESRFRLYQLTIDDPKHGKISKTLDRLDAIECAVFY
ncbi:unnamed protein product [Nippostrongylus brasiliensis]|uniref:Exostosin domain-containing protein n=1 Tax=Nippostrongylus brasiliensis TaxID=27835 RepID=A0A0N4XCS7_NIPBR|nr:unnamed protein product [Nippostrongylus brasiliensis]